MTAQIERLRKDVGFLTDLRPFRNYTNLESLKKVREYLKDEFTSCALPVEEQTWKTFGNEYANIIASYKHEKSRRLIVGAHYDVAGNQPGADDNASGIAGLLETARLIAKHQPDLDYRIDFVAYCLEEPPFFGTEHMGSYTHAKSLYQQKTEVIGMLCYEMIGYFSDLPASQRFPYPKLAELYPNTGNFIALVGIREHIDFNTKIHDLMKEHSKIDIQLVTFFDDNRYADLSDHRNYWEFDFRAIMINDTSDFRNPNYHKITDTMDTLDFNKMAEVVNSAYHAVVKIGAMPLA